MATRHCGAVTASTRALASPDYTPNLLLDTVAVRLQLRTDRALAKYTGLQPSIISKIRRRTVAITPTVLVALLDAVPDMTLAQARSLAGLPSWRRPG